MKKTTNKKRITAVLFVLVLAFSMLFTGCGTSEEELLEKTGKGFFRDVDFGMSLEEIRTAEEERKDTGDPEDLLEYSCICYHDATWDGYSADIYYICNKDGEHLDTIMISVDSNFEYERSWKTLATLYTDGSEPETNTTEYFVWSDDTYILLAQNNSDGTAMITIMLRSAVDETEETEESDET